VQKPSDLNLQHLLALNFDSRNDIALEDFIPSIDDGIQHLPPISKVIAYRNSLDSSSRLPSMPDLFSHHKHALLLSNGSKAPDPEMFTKFVKELNCDTEDGLRFAGSRKPRPGHPTPHFSHFRKFWAQLELMSQFWDTSLDNYYEVDRSVPSSPEKSSFKSLRRLSLTKTPRSEPASGQSGKRYRGRRIGTGSKMPEQFRSDAVRAFVEAIAWVFGCHMSGPRQSSQLEIRKLLIPVTQAATGWRTPQDKAEFKRGILEGPVLGVQCRPETAFPRNTYAAVLDSAREMAGLLLLAQERAREGKPKVSPGEGKWYTTKPRWGGGPGGEFGEAEGNTDPSPGQARRGSAPVNIPLRLQKPNEEQIWKELRPGNSLWEPRKTYLAIGRDRRVHHDTVSPFHTCQNLAEEAGLHGIIIVPPHIYPQTRC